MIPSGDFWLADTRMEVVLAMLFFLLSDTDIGLQRGCLEELYNAEAMPFGHYQVRVEFVDRREFAVVAPLNKSFRSNNASEYFDNTCLDSVGYQGSAPEFTNNAANHQSEMVRYKLAPM